MVTSNKQTEKKVVKMTTPNNNDVVPHRTLLGEVNEHITCPLCRGYYIDATTIVECLHSFCRSCIIKHLQVKKYCPVCEMMINSAKPNIKLDKALQDIVYKLVPGLFQKEMERRQQFYSSRPGPAASATPEQRGEDTERIIFSPEDVISFSLEYSDVTDTDSISSKSSDSNESQSTSTTHRRYLQCPAVVNISHLKKFLSMKFDIDSTQFAIDILYKRVPLPDYYTLMDIAYIYNWKRNEPMRFFYQIIDYVAIRNRLFDLNRKGSQLQDKKATPAVAEDTHNMTNLNDHASEASSGTDSPMLDENHTKKSHETTKKSNNIIDRNKTTEESASEERCNSPVKKSDDEEEKSQFLISFELTAKNSSLSAKTSPCKNVSDNASSESNCKTPTNSTLKAEDTLKRKYQTSGNLPEMKKVKIELEKAKLSVSQNVSSSNVNSKSSNINDKNIKNIEQNKTIDNSTKVPSHSANNVTTTITTKDSKQSNNFPKQQVESIGQKRGVPESHSNLTPKRKPETISSSSLQKTVSPLKIQLSKTESPSLVGTKQIETPKAVPKKMPDLKPSTPGTASNKNHISGKVRMDLLANNSDPTIDRSKILSQVKTSVPPSGPNTGDNLKSLFDSCKINIPSSLSITLTDQKSPSDLPISEQKKSIINKNLTNTNSLSNHKVPSPPVHNYIEIKKLPDTDSKKTAKPEGMSDTKINIQKSDNGVMTPKTSNKTNETSAKGPVPNLKPIADTKLAKQSGNTSAPITFQQTFEQQLQSLQTDTKAKGPKNKTQVPKLVPATPKAFSAVNKLNNANCKTPISAVPSGENKTTTALDLSTPHSIQSQLGPQQTKAFETMQSIANLAKKQNLPPKSIPLTLSQNVFPGVSNRPITTSSPLRIPGNNAHTKLDKPSTNLSQISNIRQDIPKQINAHKASSHIHTTSPSPNYQGVQASGTSTQPSPRSQTRSPSSSPKLVIAEDKQTSSVSSEHNQSIIPLNPQLSNIFAPRSDSPKNSHSLPKPGLKPMKPLIPTCKLPANRQPITPTLNTNTAMSSQADYLSHALFRHQMEMQSAWLKAQREYDIFKNLPNMAAIQSQNEFNNKDKQ